MYTTTPKPSPTHLRQSCGRTGGTVATPILPYPWGPRNCLAPASRGLAQVLSTAGVEGTRGALAGLWPCRLVCRGLAPEGSGRVAVWVWLRGSHLQPRVLVGAKNGLATCLGGRVWDLAQLPAGCV